MVHMEPWSELATYALGIYWLFFWKLFIQVSEGGDPCHPQVPSVRFLWLYSESRGVEAGLSFMFDHDGFVSK